MKKILSAVLLTLLLCTIMPYSVLAADNLSTLTPYELTATPMAVDGTHPYGSALLTFKINNLPLSTDSTHWEVVIEKKIGNREWLGVSGIPTEILVEQHQTAPGNYFFEQIWIEDYNWDGTSQISYRALVQQYDETWWTVGKSSYSNIASIGLVASPWAVPELEKAEALGLIPGILKGADMTKPITREEFAELSVVLDEKVSGLASSPASPNPFKDTSNPQILKAYSLGIVKGISADRFEPKTLVTREQCAAMLFRTIKILRPDSNFSVAGVKDFPDQKQISDYAVEATKYMSKSGIITGDAQGNFMPKATTTAQQAAGYGMATREQAIALAMRTYNSLQ